MVDVNIFNKSVGLLKVGYITGYNADTGKTLVQLNDAVPRASKIPIEIPVPLSLFYNNGMCIGTAPSVNTPIVVAQESGGQHYAVSNLIQNPALLPKFRFGELLISGNDNTKITLDINNDINIGSISNRMHINSVENILSSNFNNNYNFTQASRFVNGIIKRDLVRNTQIPQSSKLEDDSYDSKYYTIGMDPSVTTNPFILNSKKNPAFVEHRELVYEFQNSANVKSEIIESYLYKDNSLPPQDTNFINRRQSRADTLSLTLSEPNYLMETIKGTVVDIFGNILDLNRAPLSIGSGQNTISGDQGTDKSISYFQIRELERKSIAYHFEINARKDLSGSNGSVALPDINSNKDYARNRSRFFIDIDKEGQFKINVPASSETGNIPLLARYENFSSFYLDEDGKVNPNKLICRDDKLDIFLDSFSAPYTDKWTNTDLGSKNRGSITIKDGDGIATPIDRITETSIKHGTAYHDILATCNTMVGTDFIDYQYDTKDLRNINITTIAEANEHLSNVVTDTINISGTSANAGGRSGAINLDGSFEFNIGANTIDRQSLWLDTAGGIVANIGRDLKNKSLAMNMDGDVYIQLGGYGISTDSRFLKQFNGVYGATLDIRVMTSGNRVTMLRISNDGVQVLTPGNLQFHGTKGVKITSGADITIEAETLTLQGRMVKKDLTGSI